MNEQTRMSVTETMAQRFGMMPKNFEAVLRATVVPKECSPEQFAAFLLVARKYNLDPIAREVYAFPRPNGGIQPIVSVDGWMSIINSHPQMDGIEFEDSYTSEGELYAIKCRIHRKDRQHPTEITEYMTECRRGTATWQQWPIRMLRHKAAIQCARYAFGFSGIVDPDEFERWTEKPVAEKKSLGKKAMTREFKSWEASGEPEVWTEPAQAEEPGSMAKKAYTVDDLRKMQPMSTPPGPNDVESAADAYALGRKAFLAHAGRTQWPGGWRDQTNIEEWITGWDDEKNAAEMKQDEEPA